MLWQRLLHGNNDEVILYEILREIVDQRQSLNFPAEAASILLGLLDEMHEPQVWLLACMLVGQMCNLTSVARDHLAQRGALSSLTSVLGRSLSSMTGISMSSQKAELYLVLVKSIVTLLQHFSLGTSVCISKILQRDSFNVILSAVNCNNCALHGYGSAEMKRELDSLVAGRSIVGRRVWAPSESANCVYSRLLGCDIADIVGTELTVDDSYVVDLYDTNTEDDIHVIDQLTSRTSSEVWQSLSDDLDGINMDDGEWVDVHITCVLDAAHFAAVFGAEHFEQFQQLRETIEATAANRFTHLTHLPSRGQQVCVLHPKLGGFWAYVVNAESSEKILIFAPDFGYVVNVPLSYLKTFDHYSVTVPSVPLVHVCKLMG